jgi:hypothetical protein
MANGITMAAFVDHAAIYNEVANATHPMLKRVTFIPEKTEVIPT